MYILTVAAAETLEGVRFSATLHDRLDSGSTELVATHGPLLREEPDVPVEDLAELLKRLERYLALLEYGVAVQGVMDNELF